MIDSKEAFMSKFKRTKKRLEKRFPGAKLHSTPNGKFYVGQQGSNIIGEEYIDLAIANSGWEAWRNLDTVEHWNRINTRNKKKLRKDAKEKHMCGFISNGELFDIEFHAYEIEEKFIKQLQK